MSSARMKTMLGLGSAAFDGTQVIEVMKRRARMAESLWLIVGFMVF